MSTEAQFYEARRLQSAIDRRQSLQIQNEIDKQFQQSSHIPDRIKPIQQFSYIPDRIFRQENKNTRCTCIPMRRSQSLFQRNRDIYPRPLPIVTDIRRHIQRPKLRKRFSSTDYLQQW